MRILRDEILTPKHSELEISTELEAEYFESVLEVEIENIVYIAKSLIDKDEYDAINSDDIANITKQSLRQAILKEIGKQLFGESDAKAN